MQFEDTVREFILLARQLREETQDEFSFIPQLREHLEALPADTVIRMLGVMYVGSSC